MTDGRGQVVSPWRISYKHHAWLISKGARRKDTLDILITQSFILAFIPIAYIPKVTIQHIYGPGLSRSILGFIGLAHEGKWEHQKVHLRDINGQFYLLIVRFE